VELLNVAGLAVRHRARQAVRGEEDLHSWLLRRVEARERLSSSLGQRVDEGGLIVPRADGRDLDLWVRRLRSLEGAQVATHDDGRELRRHHQPDHALGARPGQLSEPVCDERRRVAHPDGHPVVDIRFAIGARSIERILQGRCLLSGDPRERGSTDQGEPAAHLGDQVLGHRPAAPHARQIRRHVVQRLGRPEGHQEHANGGHVATRGRWFHGRSPRGA
jgi:hypothetical protein